MKKPFEVKITRKNKKEAEQAISDLLARGFVISHDLTEVTASNTHRGSFNYRKGKYTSIEMGINSAWMAKLVKEEA